MALHRLDKSPEAGVFCEFQGRILWVNSRLFFIQVYTLKSRNFSIFMLWKAEKVFYSIDDIEGASELDSFVC